MNNGSRILGVPSILMQALTLSLVGVLMAPLSLQAQAWKPSKTIEIITGTGAGSDLDRAARAIHHIATSKGYFPVPAIVLNKPGANSSIAWSYLNERQGQGEYIAISSPPLITNVHLTSSKLNHKDVTPLAKLYDVYMCLVVKADSPIKDVRDLVKRASADSKSSWALTGGAGSVPHILLSQLQRAGKLTPESAVITHYKAAGEMMAAVLGGHIDLVSSTIPNVIPAVKNGQVRVLAIASPKRLSGLLAPVPTLKEQGFDIVSANWRGVIGPRDLNPQQVAYWDELLGKVLNSPEWKRTAEEFFWETDHLDSKGTAAFLAQQDKELTNALREVGAVKK